MTTPANNADGNEETLDPADWNETKRLAHKMMDDVLNDLETIRSRPAWKPMPEAVRNTFGTSAPRTPQSLDSIYEEFRENIEPFAIGNRHPKFWGWVIGSGTTTGLLGELLASAMNTNSTGFNQSATLVEAEVLNWFKEVMGFPRDGSGILVSSGSAANLTALIVARDALLPDSLDGGLLRDPRQPLIYASEQVHNSVDKAVGIIGLGRSSLRRIETNDDFTINVAALRKAIERDKANGAMPICVVGTAGTVATGAMDDLVALADICAEHRIWFHVDGAFGAIAALSEKLRPMLKGMERADSVAFDLHKWLCVNYDAGCVLFRNAELHSRSFSIPASYLSTLHGGIATGDYKFGDLGIDLSRNFRALKAWMSIKNFGFDKYARMVEQNVAQAAYLASLVESHPDLELVAPVPLNVVCFRFARPGISESGLDEINERILVRLQVDGLAVPSAVHIRCKFALRVANVNHRSRREDFEALVTDAARLGAEMVGGDL